MWKRFCGASVVVTAAWSLASCQSTPRKAAAPLPESQQIIHESLKNLYMSASAASPQSKEQQRSILRMAEQASTGKELLLTLRASVGVFPMGDPRERDFQSTVALKMIQCATVEQLADFASQYPVNAQDARPLLERMFQLGGTDSDPRVWSRIRLAAYHLKVPDLEQQAQSRVNQLAGR